MLDFATTYIADEITINWSVQYIIVKHILDSVINLIFTKKIHTEI